jgi:hypothetical protein
LYGIAEDHGGNAFCTTKDRAVWFWDHETDDTERLAGSIADSVAQCIEPPPVRLDRKRVKSVWIDPAFAKRIAKQVSADGWAEKKSKPA